LRDSHLTRHPFCLAHRVHLREKGLYPKPSSYASPEALWIEHTLEPFRGWLDKLTKSAGVAFIDYDGATEAKLLQEGDQIPELAVEVVGRSLLIGRIDA